MAQYRLVMRTGPNPGQTFELDKDEITLGRDIQSDIIINDAEVSRKHARLTQQGGDYILEDLGSTNGTFVDGQRLRGPHLMRPGELILFGEKVSLAYEPLVDLDATQVSAAQPGVPQAPPPIRETYTPAYQEPQPERVPPPQPAPYSGQVPPGPVEEEVYYEDEEPGSGRVWLYAGCGCLVVVLCVLVGAAIVFDTLNLYCTPPFSTLFACP